MKPLNRIQILLVLGFVVFGAIIWHIIRTVTFFGAVDYLNQLYYVFWHEGMHATTTVLTLGSVDQMMVMHRLGGYVYSRGAAALIVFPAGYIGPVIISCLILYRSINHPEQSHRLTFWLGVASMFIAGLFTTTEPILRFLSVGFVLANILLLGIGFRNFRVGAILYIVIALSFVILFVQHVHETNDDSANLTFLVGASVGGLLVFTGATEKVFLSLVVLSVVNSSLLYTSITRATTEIIPQVQAGIQNDAAMLAGGLGWNPMIIAIIWMFIIALVCTVSAIAIVKVVVESH